MKKLIHRLHHLFGCNTGTVETWWAKCGKLMVGFRCDCGQLSGIHPSVTENATAAKQ